MDPDDDVLRWAGRAAGELADAAVRVGLLAAAVADDWLDETGRAWVERIEGLRRDLDGAADDAADLGALWAAAARAAAGRGSPQLGGTEGARVDDTPGMRIAELLD